MNSRISCWRLLSPVVVMGVRPLLVDRPVADLLDSEHLFDTLTP
jgi:hypothetical protein